MIIQLFLDTLFNKGEDMKTQWLIILCVGMLCFLLGRSLGYYEGSKFATKVCIDQLDKMTTEIVEFIKEER